MRVGSCVQAACWCVTHLCVTVRVVVSTWRRRAWLHRSRPVSGSSARVLRSTRHVAMSTSSGAKTRSFHCPRFSTDNIFQLLQHHGERFLFSHEIELKQAIAFFVSSPLTSADGPSMPSGSAASCPASASMVITRCCAPPQIPG